MGTQDFDENMFLHYAIVRNPKWCAKHDYARVWERFPHQATRFWEAGFGRDFHDIEPLLGLMKYSGTMMGIRIGKASGIETSRTPIRFYEF